MSLQVINEDQYTISVAYKEGTYPLTRDEIGTRYVITAVRILVNPDDAQDADKVHALQDSIKVTQKSPGSSRRRGGSGESKQGA